MKNEAATKTGLWDRVSKTDPAHVKPITGKQYSGNSPKPYYIVRRLTEEFGPCGVGWGFSVLSERFERFSDTDSLHVALLEFWYVAENDAIGKFQQMGQTKASYVSGAGKFILDEDAPKKSVTDALVKCASYLGFAGDIFMGLWDDSKYVNELRKEFAEDKPAPKGVMGAVMKDEPALHPNRASYVESLGKDIEQEFFDNNRTAESIKELIEKESLEHTERLYLWSLLDSKIRTALTELTRPKPSPPNVERMSPGPGLKKIGVRVPT